MIKKVNGVWGSIALPYNERILTTDEILYPCALRSSNKIKGKKILDIGCGTGHFSHILQKQGAKVIGIDSSKEMINIAKNNYPSIKFYNLSVENLNKLEDSNFDYVIAIMVFLCFNNKDKINLSLRKINKKLRKNGELIIIDLHPCAKRSFKTEIVKQKFPEKSYFKSGIPFETILTNETGKSMTFFNYNWTLEDYFDLLKKSNFIISELEELKPSNESIAKYPSLKPFFEIPQYLLIKAKKDII